MSTRQPSATVARAASSKRPSASEDLLKLVRDKASEVRDLERERSDLEERLSEVSDKINKIYRDDLPALMDQAGVDRVGLPSSGNLPACDAVLQPYYSANIAASWPDDRRQAALATIERLGHGDLIKTQIEMSFPRGHLEKARSLATQFEKKGYAPNLRETVHSQTLTAWLREQCQAGQMPSSKDLEAIGGSVGRVVRLKERKE